MSPKILWLHRQSSAVGSYRCLGPAKALTKLGYDITCPEKAYSSLKPDLQAYLSANLGKFDLIMVDRVVKPDELPLFAGFRHASPNTRMVVDFDDDWMNVPWWNQSHGNYKPGNMIYESGKSHLKLSEMVSVSTPTLAERFKDKTHAIMCVENGIDPDLWDNLPVNPERAGDPSLRVLYGGASGHFGDMDEARLGLETVLENPPVPFRLICFGATPSWIYDISKKYPGRIIRLPCVEFEDYPQAIAWGGFDVAIAPLADHVFNEAKSNIKWLEAGIQKIPFLCSDIGPYQSIPRGCAIKVSNTPVQWAEGLSALLTDANLRNNLRTQAYEAVQDTGTVDKTAKRWQVLIEEAMARPRIETLEDTRLPSEILPEPNSDG